MTGRRFWAGARMETDKHDITIPVLKSLIENPAELYTAYQGNGLFVVECSCRFRPNRIVTEILRVHGLQGQVPSAAHQLIEQRATANPIATASHPLASRPS